jgi:hypothetical protein
VARLHAGPGEAVDWYPYPFVDVSRVGYDGVLLRSALLLVLVVALAAAVVWVGNRRGAARGAVVAPGELSA